MFPSSSAFVCPCIALLWSPMSSTSPHSLLWSTGSSLATTSGVLVVIPLINESQGSMHYIIYVLSVLGKCFLSAYYRMNTALKQEVAESKEINASSRDKSRSVDPFKSSWSSITNPLGIKRKHQFPSTAYLVESYGSSSSYGSLDEETFIRRLTPPDLDYRDHNK